MGLACLRGGRRKGETFVSDRSGHRVGDRRHADDTCDLDDFLSLKPADEGRVVPGLAEATGVGGDAMDRIDRDRAERAFRARMGAVDGVRGEGGFALGAEGAVLGGAGFGDAHSGKSTVKLPERIEKLLEYEDSKGPDGTVATASIGDVHDDKYVKGTRAVNRMAGYTGHVSAAPPRRAHAPRAHSPRSRRRRAPCPRPRGRVGARTHARTPARSPARPSAHSLAL